MKRRRDDLETQLNRSALWAVTYGDLMSYLMIFFLIMFSFGIAKRGATTQQKKYEETLMNIQKVFGGKTSSADLERLKSRENEEKVADKLKQMSPNMQIEMKDKKVRLLLPEAVLFESGKADLGRQAQKLISQISEQLKAMPNEIDIEGHTDNVPIRGGRYSSNMELSMARAYAVVSYFEQLGIPAQRLAGIGYGEFHPIGDNKTSEGRAKNRRIEINFIRTE